MRKLVQVVVPALVTLAISLFECRHLDAQTPAPGAQPQAAAHQYPAKGRDSTTAHRCLCQRRSARRWRKIQT